VFHPWFASFFIWLYVLDGDIPGEASTGGTHVLVVMVTCVGAFTLFETVVDPAPGVVGTSKSGSINVGSYPVLVVIEVPVSVIR
jgi:hypothetical protein